MKIIQLHIYSLQTQPIPKGTPKNFLKGGKLSKRALTAKGSFTITLKDDEKLDWKYSELEKYGYTNIHTGYIDSTLYMEKDGEQYVAYLSMYNNTFKDGVTLGFSSYK